MAATKLGVYNEALELVGERALASLTESREPRRLLDNAWSRGFVDEVLEQGQWNFATRSAKADFSPSLEPDFGYKRVFDKPSDWVRSVAISTDEFFSIPLLHYVDEGGFWYTNIDTIYVRYVSNSTSFGGDLSTWGRAFTKYAAHELAVHIAPKLTGLAEDKLEALKKERRRALTDARSKDALNQPTQFPPPGSFVSARFGFGGHGGRGDRGSRGNLTG